MHGDIAEVPHSEVTPSSHDFPTYIRSLHADPNQPGTPGNLEPLAPAETKKPWAVDSLDNMPSDKVDEMPGDYVKDAQPPSDMVRDAIKEAKSYHSQPKHISAKSHGLHGENQIIAKWFSWQFWQLLALCTLTLFFYSEVVYPLAHIVRPQSLVIDAAIFFVQMLSFMIVAAIFATNTSAGAAHATALATIMMAISFLIFLASLSMVWGEKDKIMIKVDNDIGGLFCPFSRIIAVFLIVQGVLDESGNSLDSLTLLASFAALGIAFAIGDVVKDIVSYMFIRNKHVFVEDDFVEYGGELYQIKQVSWRNTTAYRMKTRSMALIPNSKIALCGLNNQSKDDARIMEMDIPLPGETPAENLQTIVREAWALLRGLEETGFKAFNGDHYECQIDVPETALYLGNINPGAGDGKEFPYIDLHLRLFGKYFYSKAAPWKQDVPEPSHECRQLDWLMPWKYQVEWLIVEIKKIVDRHSV
jgi:small-conductance mechanosensitive channel